jgi:hypothetical protein
VPAERPVQSPERRQSGPQVQHWVQRRSAARPVPLAHPGHAHHWGRRDRHDVHRAQEPRREQAKWSSQVRSGLPPARRLVPEVALARVALLREQASRQAARCVAVVEPPELQVLPRERVQALPPLAESAVRRGRLRDVPGMAAVRPEPWAESALRRVRALQAASAVSALSPRAAAGSVGLVRPQAERPDEGQAEVSVPRPAGRDAQALPRAAAALRDAAAAQLRAEQPAVALGVVLQQAAAVPRQAVRAGPVARRPAQPLAAAWVLLWDRVLQQAPLVQPPSAGPCSAHKSMLP